MFTPNAGRGSGRCWRWGAAAHDVIICGPARRKTLAAADANKGRLKQRADASPPASPALDCVPCSPCGRMPAETEEIAMVTVGLLVTLEAKPGKVDELASFLAGALPLAQAEPETTAWFAIKIDDSTFGIADFFPAAAGRQAHLDGPIAAALLQRAEELLAAPPDIKPVDVLAAKLPT